MLMANTLKALSDEGVNVTVVLVGVADNINELVGEHSSIIRCVELGADASDERHRM